MNVHFGMGGSESRVQYICIAVADTHILYWLLQGAILTLKLIYKYILDRQITPRRGLGGGVSVTTVSELL